jgi:hypothetical protein
MSYLHALVYHVRNPDEHEGLFAHIKETVRSERLRREVATMKQTIADMLREEGSMDAFRMSLLLVLRNRFDHVPKAIVHVVESCSSHDQLKRWIKSASKAETLEEVGIPLAE